MSAPDARLSAAERAALAGLEAAAAAADPHLAARLKGSSAARIRPVVPVVARMRPEMLRWWFLFLRLGWWGAPLAVAGLALMVLGLSAGPAVAAIGAVCALAGLRLLAEKIERRRRPRPRSAS